MNSITVNNYQPHMAGSIAVDEFKGWWRIKSDGKLEECYIVSKSDVYELTTKGQILLDALEQVMLCMVDGVDIFPDKDERDKAIFQFASEALEKVKHYA